jgi:hypothetical protein
VSRKGCKAGRWLTGEWCSLWFSVMDLPDFPERGPHALLSVELLGLSLVCWFSGFYAFRPLFLPSLFVSRAVLLWNAPKALTMSAAGLVAYLSFFLWTEAEAHSLGIRPLLSLFWLERFPSEWPNLGLEAIAMAQKDGLDESKNIWKDIVRVGQAGVVDNAMGWQQWAGAAVAGLGATGLVAEAFEALRWGLVLLSVGSLLVFAEMDVTVPEGDPAASSSKRSLLSKLRLRPARLKGSKHSRIEVGTTREGVPLAQEERQAQHDRQRSSLLWCTVWAVLIAGAFETLAVGFSKAAFPLPGGIPESMRVLSLADLPLEHHPSQARAQVQAIYAAHADVEAMLNADWHRGDDGRWVFSSPEDEESALSGDLLFALPDGRAPGDSLGSGPSWERPRWTSWLQSLSATEREMVIQQRSATLGGGDTGASSHSGPAPSLIPLWSYFDWQQPQLHAAYQAKLQAVLLQGSMRQRLEEKVRAHPELAAPDEDEAVADVDDESRSPAQLPVVASETELAPCPTWTLRLLRCLEAVYDLLSPEERRKPEMAQSAIANVVTTMGLMLPRNEGAEMCSPEFEPRARALLERIIHDRSALDAFFAAQVDASEPLATDTASVTESAVIVLESLVHDGGTDDLQLLQQSLEQVTASKALLKHPPRLKRPRTKRREAADEAPAEVFGTPHPVEQPAKEESGHGWRGFGAALVGLSLLGWVVSALRPWESGGSREEERSSLSSKGSTPSMASSAISQASSSTRSHSKHSGEGDLPECAKGPHRPRGGSEQSGSTQPSAADVARAKRKKQAKKERARQRASSSLSTAALAAELEDDSGWQVAGKSRGKTREEDERPAEGEDNSGAEDQSGVEDSSALDPGDEEGRGDSTPPRSSSSPAVSDSRAQPEEEESGPPPLPPPQPVSPAPPPRVDVVDVRKPLTVAPAPIRQDMTVAEMHALARAQLSRQRRVEGLLRSGDEAAIMQELREGAANDRQCSSALAMIQGGLIVPEALGRAGVVPHARVETILREAVQAKSEPVVSGGGGVTTTDSARSRPKRSQKAHSKRKLPVKSDSVSSPPIHTRADDLEDGEDALSSLGSWNAAGADWVQTDPATNGALDSLASPIRLDVGVGLANSSSGDSPPHRAAPRASPGASDASQGKDPGFRGTQVRPSGQMGASIVETDLQSLALSAGLSRGRSTDYLEGSGLLGISSVLDTHEPEGYVGFSPLHQGSPSGPLGSSMAEFHLGSNLLGGVGFEQHEPGLGQLGGLLDESIIRLSGLDVTESGRENE